MIDETWLLLLERWHLVCVPLTSIVFLQFNKLWLIAVLSLLSSSYFHYYVFSNLTNFSWWVFWFVYFWMVLLEKCHLDWVSLIFFSVLEFCGFEVLSNHCVTPTYRLHIDRSVLVCTLLISFVRKCPSWCCFSYTLNTFWKFGIWGSSTPLFLVLCFWLLYKINITINPY